MVTIDAFSGHAASDELISWMGGSSRPPEMTYLVHGEPPSATALKLRIATDLHRPSVVPKWKETVRLD